MGELTGAERRAVLAVAFVLAAIVAASTVLHHFFPWVLKVQSYPGLPYTGYGAMLLLDLVPLGAGALCFHHAARTLGLYRAVMFLGGIFFFSGLMENAWILLGRAGLLGAIIPQLKDVSGTYFFTRGFFWWGEMPAYICVAWFVITYACLYVLGLLAPRSGLWTRAALAGLLAMSFDLWLDPVQVHPSLRAWVWTSNEVIKIFSIPFSNYAGWFLFVFLFAIAFDKLPRLTARWGAGKGTWVFFLLLLGLKVCFLAALMLSGAAAMKYVTSPVNLTLWGI